ncbi:hypothetical protein XENOCAPTIV_026137, partial [Xenoophorus captivus]
RCVHSFHVSLINSTCVFLSWSLLHISSVPLFMVVQWFPTKQQDSEDFGLSGQTWARLPYTDPPAHLRDPKTDQLPEHETVLGGAISLDSLTTSNITINKLKPVNTLVEQGSGSTNRSAQSSVTYSKVLLTDQDHPPLQLHYKEGSRSSSSDEGNFSANNSDISESFPGGLWELDSCRGTELDDPRRSCSYNSLKELSETSNQEDKIDMRQGKPLYYLEIRPMSEDEENEEEKPESELLKGANLNREEFSVELHPLLSPEESMNPSKMLQESTCSFASLYMPQYRKHNANHVPLT